MKESGSFTAHDKVIAFVVDQAKQCGYVKKVYLFGSRAQNSGTSTSDYDFGIVWEPPDAHGWGRFCTILREQNPSLNKLDLMKMSEASPKLQNAILADGILIYEKT